jgi:hypothetical protein
LNAKKAEERKKTAAEKSIIEKLVLSTGKKLWFWTLKTRFSRMQRHLGVLADIARAF